MRTAGMKTRPLASEGLVRQFLFRQFSKVFIASFSPIRCLEVVVDSQRPINRGQIGVDGNDDVQLNASH